jgi:hypothetical protein
MLYADGKRPEAERLAPFPIWEPASHGRMSAARGPSVHLLPWSTARLLCSHRKGWFYARTGYGAPGRRCFIWKWGAICGVMLGVIQIIISLFSLGSLKTILDLLVWLIVFFVIGLFAARQTGRVRTGALVGLVTGLIGSLIAVIFAIVQIATNGQQITQALNQAAQSAQHQGRSLSSSALHTVAVVGIVLGLIVTVALELGLGAGIGALGGLVGRRQAPPVASTPVAGTVWTPPPSAQ